MHKILYIMPNKKKEFSGIYKYNIGLVKLLKKKSTIKIIYTGKTGSYFITMLYKFVFIPFFLIFNSYKFHSVIYPEEGYAFLRTFSFSKKNNIIVHDYRKIFNIKINLQKYTRDLILNFQMLIIFMKKLEKNCSTSMVKKNFILKD